MKPRWSLHALGVALLATIICALFLREPGFGDDFTYWNFAFELHERGLKAWSQESFHNLRWPVWGVSWVLQAIFGPGLIAYYGVPLLYLIAGALLAFTFGRLVSNSVGIAWTAAIAFLFHPLLDTIAFRPMPDLSEGVWGSLAVLLWWRLTQSQSRGSALGWSACLGAVIYIVESNRLTGVFIVPVLILCTVLYARRTFGWLVVAGTFSLVFYAAEAAFYHHLFGDWLHNLHANMGAKGKKGTESIALWYLPFRFLDTLWKASPLAPFYCLFAIAGMWGLWRPGSRLGTLTSEISDSAHSSAISRNIPLGRVVVVWFVTLYLAYACAPQSIWPWRPIVRDADRFLASLAIPFSVLAATGAYWFVRQLQQREQRWTRLLMEHPALTAAAVILVLIVGSSRELVNFGSIPEMRRYMRSLPEGTKVFTHDMMRGYAFLVGADSAPRLTWLYSRSSILNFKPELETLAAQAQEFWYIRKLVWLNTRKGMEEKKIDGQAKLASYFAEPEREWTMARVLPKGDTPDLVFHRRRTETTPPPRILEENAPEFAGLLPAFPIEWKGVKKDMKVEKIWPIPQDLRGQLARVEIEAASDQVQAFTVTITFKRGRKTLVEYLLKPYTHLQPGKEFFEFQIPADADQSLLELKITKNTKSVRFSDFRVIVEPPK